MNIGVISFLGWSITENMDAWIFAALSYMPMVWYCCPRDQSSSYLPCSGALGSWGAALLAPYSDKPESHGLMLNSPEILETLVRQFWKDGWQTVRFVVLLVERRLINIWSHFSQFIALGTEQTKWFWISTKASLHRARQMYRNGVPA